MPDQRVSDLGAAAVAADREARRQRSLRELKACQMWELATGETLPRSRLFQDADGSLWELGLIATVRLVEKGTANE